MAKYQEQFSINGRLYGIDGELKVWASGCRIYTGETIEDARKMLHTYACNQERANIGSHQEIVDRATSALERLGTDPFNLGKFLS